MKKIVVSISTMQQVSQFPFRLRSQGRLISEV